MRNFCSLFYVLCIFFQVFFSMVAVAGDVSVRVAAGNSDAEERFDGKVSLTSSDLEMVFEKVGNQTVGIRFADISIPQGATISQAYIQFTVDEPTAESTTLLIEGELNANAAIFQSIYFDISSRSRTATNVLWSPAPWFNVGEAAADQRTPDISALVQEIIGQNDWLPGNAIAFIISGAGERVAESFNGKPEAAAQLFITFDGENINQAPQVDAGGDASITLPSTQLTLSGSVNDDGKPSNTLTTVWQHVGGTGVGDVSFADSALINTLATFSADPGTYVLRLTADDGELSAFSERTVVVNPVGLVWLEVPIISTADDAEQRSNGSISMSSSDLELVFEKTGNQVVGMRFQAINLPAQATVLNAYIQFTVDEISNNPTQLSIRGEANSAAAAFVKSDFNISARVTTNANVDWLPNPWLFVGAAGIEQRSPNLASIVQEILASPGWTPGNALVFIITGSGERVAESFDGVAAAAPRLFIEYSGEVVNTPPTVSAGTDATLVLPHNSITLQASASDDGLPTNNLSAMWMHSGGSGAGVVNFTNANQLQTTATFGNSPGTYHLQLAVSDGELTTTDRITITVHAGGEVIGIQPVNAFATGFNTNGSVLTIPSIDPAGVVYHEPSATLFLADSEINEVVPVFEFVRANLFKMSSTGATLFNQWDLTQRTGNEPIRNREPTGITYCANDDHFYVTNDDAKMLYRYAHAAGSFYAVDAVSTLPHGTDPEGVTCDPSRGYIYVIGGAGLNIYVYEYSGGFSLQQVLDLTQTAGQPFGIPLDPEGIAFDPVSEHLFVISDPDRAIFEFNTNGVYVNRFSVDVLSPTPLRPQGLSIGTSSNDPTSTSFYIADGRVDNDENPNERDGQIYEARILRAP